MNEWVIASPQGMISSSQHNFSVHRKKKTGLEDRQRGYATIRSRQNLKNERHASNYREADKDMHVNTYLEGGGSLGAKKRTWQARQGMRQIKVRAMTVRRGRLR
jgi:hypothetical protein